MKCRVCKKEMVCFGCGFYCDNKSCKNYDKNICSLNSIVNVCKLGRKK